MFVILTEYVGIRHRHVLGTLMFFAWPLSGMLLAGIGYVTRDWRTQSIVVGVLGMPVVFCWWYVIPLLDQVKFAETKLKKSSFV